MIDRTPTWNLDELAAQVALALSAGNYAGAESGRVRDIPDARAIRYYTTLGLIDRAAEMRGRVAMYSPRHLAQIVAIKKLQARGMSLSQVQEMLTGIAEKALEGIAQLDVKRGAESSIDLQSPKPDAQKKSRKDSSFWSRPPAAEQAAPREEAELRSTEARETIPAPPVSTAVMKPAPMSGLKLGDRAMLLFEAARAPEAADLEAIAAAAAPLLAVLEKRGLM